MREMLELLVKQLKVELNKKYYPTQYNPQRNTSGQRKQNRTYPKRYTGNLAESIEYEIREIDGEETGIILLADYYEFVDRGRKPGGEEGKGGFREALDRWTRLKIGTFPGLDFKSTSYLVRRSVWMKGIGGINFINNAIDNIIDELIDKGEEEYADKFEEFIDDKLLVLSKTSKEITYNR